MQGQRSIILSSAYFPPVQYFAYMMEADNTIIETHENYSKQTYRNRCNILSPNGLQTLSVPVERGSFHKVAMKDLRIDYSKPWQKNHIRSLKTAYNSSAFYDYMKDDIESCILKTHKFLLDLNMSIMVLVSNLLELDLNFMPSDKYLKEYTSSADLRDSIHPKKINSDFVESAPSYFQVFSDREEFHPDLSILDLMFNMGLESISYLRSCKLK